MWLQHILSESTQNVIGWCSMVVLLRHKVFLCDVYFCAIRLPSTLSDVQIQREIFVKWVEQASYCSKLEHDAVYLTTQLDQLYEKETDRACLRYNNTLTVSQLSQQQSPQLQLPGMSTQAEQDNKNNEHNQTHHQHHPNLANNEIQVSGRSRDRACGVCLYPAVHTSLWYCLP